MARYEDFTLSASQAARVATYTRSLVAKATAGDMVTVAFTKRNGEPRVITGPIVEVGGKGSHAFVMVETEQGPRSANLWAISEVS